MLVFVSCSDVVVWRRCEDDAVNAAAGGQYMATAAKTKVSDFFMVSCYMEVYGTQESSWKIRVLIVLFRVSRCEMSI